MKTVIAIKNIEFLEVEIKWVRNNYAETYCEKMQIFLDKIKDKKQLQSFWMFIKTLAKHRKVFSLLLKKNARFIWTERHTKWVSQLKNIYKNLSKMVIPQDKDELILYTDVTDY